jgi:hypothetical protein
MAMLYSTLTDEERRAISIAAAVLRTSRSDVSSVLDALVDRTPVGPQPVDDLWASQVEDAVISALTEAREDIRARYRIFTDLNADQPYLNALSDAYGLVNNRISRRTEGGRVALAAESSL